MQSIREANEYVLQTVSRPDADNDVDHKSGTDESAISDEQEQKEILLDYTTAARINLQQFFPKNLNFLERALLPNVLTALFAKFKRVGDCGEHCALGVQRLITTGFKGRIELMEVQNVRKVRANQHPNKHFLTVIMRDKESSEKNPSTWKDGTIIFDSHTRGEKVKEYKKGMLSKKLLAAQGDVEGEEKDFALTPTLTIDGPLKPEQFDLIIKVLEKIQEFLKGKIEKTQEKNYTIFFTKIAESVGIDIDPDEEFKILNELLTAEIKLYSNCKNISLSISTDNLDKKIENIETPPSPSKAGVFKDKAADKDKAAATVDPVAKPKDPDVPFDMS